MNGPCLRATVRAELKRAAKVGQPVNFFKLREETGASQRQLVDAIVAIDLGMAEDAHFERRHRYGYERQYRQRGR